MKIKCQKQFFAKALQTISGVAIQRDIYPILENVRISTDNNQLLLKATDLKISVTYILNKGIEIIEPGELLLPAAKLNNLVKETPDEEFRIEKDDFNGVLITKDGRFYILGENPQKFPEIPCFQEKGTMEISGEDFRKLINKTLFATTAEKTRYDFDNVMVNILENTIRFVSTDGKRLALCEKKYQSLGDIKEKQFTVPAQGLQQIQRVLSTTSPGKVILNVLENQFLFRTEDVILSTRLSDGKFPPYEKVMPQVLPYKIFFAQKDFASALRRVCLLADEKNKIVQITFNHTCLNLFCRGEGTGEANVEIPAVYDGEPFSIKFNPNFLLDVLKVIDNSEINIFLQDGQSAILLKDGDDFRYVVLPIKVEEKKEEIKDGSSE